MKVKGVKFGLYLSTPTPALNAYIVDAQRVDQMGFDSLWAADHLLTVPSGGKVPDVWTMFTAIASVTSHVRLGSFVSDAFRRHPAVFAQQLATLDCLSNGRVTLGMGAGEMMNLEQFGIRWEKPVSRFVEAVEIMRKLWSGEVFDYEGQFWQLKDAVLQIQPLQESIPIYFGANGSRTKELTGRIGDGWLPCCMSPELYKKHLKDVKEGARKAGRSIDEIDRVLYVYTAISEDHESALKQLEPYKASIVLWPKILDGAGYVAECPAIAEADFYSNILMNEEGERKFEEYGKFVPMEVVEDFSIAGTVDDCIEQIEDYIEAGVSHFAFVPVGPEPMRVLLRYSRDIIPYFKNR
ncbi:MAG: LLM class flavin-dependent oxidoreductase [Methanosarcinales archaeon]|nr:LLM class flavin-dependent oxidoreductase [Methanosarcinales archaeon]